MNIINFFLELEQYKCDYCNHVPVQHKLIIENQSIEIKGFYFN